MLYVFEPFSPAAHFPTRSILCIRIIYAVTPVLQVHLMLIKYVYAGQRSGVMADGLQTRLKASEQEKIYVDLFGQIKSAEVQKVATFLRKW